MTIPLLRDLEQRWREEAQHDEARSSTARSRRRTRRTSQHADELAAVRRTLEARLEGLTRYAVYARELHRADGGFLAETIEEVHTAGGFMRADDLEAALGGVPEPR